MRYIECFFIKKLLKLSKTMNWKIFGLIAFTILIIMTSVIVWNNRASDRLVSNFMSVVFLGLTGLLITSLTSLKKETERERFAAVMFLSKKPLYLVNYKHRLKHDRILPIIMTNPVIEQLVRNNKKFANTDHFASENYWKLSDDLFARYLFDLLATRYLVHWYNESIEIKGPNVIMGTGGSIDADEEKIIMKWSELKKVFPKNDFFEVGNIYNSTEKKDGFQSQIALPPKTTLKRNAIANGFEIIFDNDFIELSIKCKHQLQPGSAINMNIANAFKLEESEYENFIFQPYVIDYRITKKKFRTGHPDMGKYYYWSTDLIQFLKRNISVDEFWRVVELNNL